MDTLKEYKLIVKIVNIDGYVNGENKEKSI